MDSVACQLSRDGLDIGSVPVNTGPMFILLGKTPPGPNKKSPATDAAAGTEGDPASERIRKP
jgi:hypothetical protein